MPDTPAASPRTISRYAYVVNAAGLDTSLYDMHDAIMAYVRHDTPIPEEFTDIIRIDMVELADGWRGVVNWF